MKKIFFMLVVLSMLFVLSLSFVSANSGVSTLRINIINQNPDPVVAGDVVELRLSVENLGSNAVNNLVVKINDTYPFTLLDSNDALQSFGPINGFQEGDDAKIITYKFKVDSQAVAGIYDLDINYYDASDLSVAVKTSVSIDVKNLESAEISSISKSVFYPGEQDKLIFTIKNVGNAPLNDLFFSFDTQDGVLLPVGSGSTRYIKKIPVGGEVEVEYVVVADSSATVGLYGLDLSLDFKNALTGSSEKTTTTSGVYIGGETDFVLALSQSQGTEYSFTVANIGMTQAGAVTVSVPTQDSWKFSGAGTSVIGNLNTGDYTLVSFTLSPTKDKGPLELVISYTDTMGVRHNVVKSLSLDSIGSEFSLTDGAYAGSGSMHRPGSKNAPSSSSNNTVVLIIVIVVGLVIVYFVRKKLRSKKKITSHHTKTELK